MRPQLKRLERLEQAYWPGLKTGVYYHEVCFLVKFKKKWPDHREAPKFALAAYQEISKRLVGRR